MRHYNKVFKHTKRSEQYSGFRLRSGLILFAALLSILTACSRSFVKVRSNRALYPVSAAVAQDSAIIKTYIPYKQKLDNEMNKVLGKTTQALTKGTNAPESLLGNFFVDATLIEALKLYPDIDFAFTTTTGGMRAELPKGPVTLSNVFELMPFDNELLILELKGSDVLILLNFIAGSGGQPVSGLKMKISNKQATSIYIKGVPFNVNRNYKVLVSDYLAWGGDNTFGLQYPLTTTHTKLDVRAALLQYIKNTTDQGKEINSALDGRITKD